MNSSKGFGQALVETALIAPILIFLLIGVFEVGWALRGYLVLVSASRETTRFAVRPNYLTYDEEGYNRVINHLFSTLSNQIEFTESGTIIISVLQIDTQWVCDPFNRDANSVLICDCALAIQNPYSQTLIMSPLTQVTLTHKHPISSTKISNLDFIEITDKLVLVNREFNCRLMKANSVPSVDTLVYVELFYDQPQLMGFPLISNPFTDPFPLYAHTVMRKFKSRE